MDETTPEVPKLEVIFKQEGKEDIVFTLSQEGRAMLTTDSVEIELIVDYLQSFINYHKALEMVR
jgi:hypothetical protein